MECPTTLITKLVNNQYSGTNSSDSGLVASSVGLGFFSIDFEVIITCREGFTPSTANTASFDRIRCLSDAKWTESKLKCKSLPKIF